MTKLLPTLSLLVLSCAVSAETVQVGDLAGFREALRRVEAPPAPAAALPPKSERPSCMIEPLSGATVGRGLFDSDFAVKRGDAVLGRVVANQDGYTYVNGGATLAFFAVLKSGKDRFVAVSNCDGELIGKVVEEDEANATAFWLEDANGAAIAHSGWVDGSNFILAGKGGSAVVADDAWFSDRYALTIRELPSPLVLAATVLNNAALYRRKTR